MQMQSFYPQPEESEESREGTAAHWLLSMTLRKVHVPDDAIAPNGVPINDEMREAIRELVTDVNANLIDLKPGDFWQDERTKQAAHLIHPDNWGTSDVEFVKFSTKQYFLWDFKYGHLFVDVFKNWQAINYCATAIETYQIPDPENWTFIIKIAQPRCYARDVLGGSLRTWAVNGPEMMQLISQLSQAAYEASTPNAPVKTGDHCQFCIAAFDCEANQRAGGRAIDMIYSQYSLGMSEAHIGLEAKMLARAEKRVADRLAILDEKILHAFNTGRNVPHHRIEFSDGRTVWQKDKIEEVADLIEMFGIEVKRGVALPTPRECIKRGIDAAVIKPYVQQNSGAKKIVRVTDNDAAKIFGRRD